jgi:hypothetical protein
MPRTRIAIAGLILAGVAGFARAEAPAVEGAWILNCQMPSNGSASSERVFRIAPRVFQEWKPADKAFGNNLCASFPCSADRNRLEGTISSPSVVLTVQVDRRTGGASWSTQGASNLATSKGACTIRKEAAGQPR